MTKLNQCSDTQRPRGDSHSRIKRDPQILQSQLELVIQANVDGMIIVDRHGYVRYNNRSAERIFGIASGKLLGSEFGIASVNGDGAEVDIHPEGGRRLVAELRAASILWEEEPCQLLSIRDITTRKEMEEALERAQRLLRGKVEEQSRELKSTVGELHREMDHRQQTEQDLLESEERFRLAFEHGPVGKVIIDAENRIVQANRAMAQMLNSTAKELLGRDFAELTSIDAVEPELTFAQQLLDGDIAHYTVERQLIRDDGDSIVCRITSSVISRSNDRPVYVLSLIENVTEQRRLQEMARRQERLAAIGTLAAGIAHEINNPAGAALLSAETALTYLEKPDSEDQIRSCLENIVSAAERCGRIIRNTLRFSHENGGNRRPRDINQIARKSKDLVRMTMERTQSRVEFRLDETVPLIPVNELEMELVFVNLIKNSLQASSQPTKAVVETRRLEDAVEIAVTDDGPGLTAYQKSRAFDPFYTTRQSSGGTGLGLSIVHGIVQDHGGTIEIESEEGMGTTFRIRLPLVMLAEQEISE